MSEIDRTGYWAQAKQRDMIRDWVRFRQSRVSSLRESADFERGYKAALEDVEEYLLRLEQRAEARA